VAFAETKGIRRRPVLIAQSRNIMARQIESYIIRNMLDEDSFYRSFLRDDKTIQQAVEVLKKGESFPKAPSND
jgi:carboxyl-terminal processing protease